MTKSELEQIATQYYNEIHSFCLRKLNYNINLADDLVQDVFLLLQMRHDNMDNKNLRAWLYSVADKKIKETYRKTNNTVSIESMAIDIPVEIDILSEIENSISNDEIEIKKTDIINKLPAKEKELYFKIYIANKKYAEIAKEYNTTENTIKLRAFRLRKHIKELLKITLSFIFCFF